MTTEAEAPGITSFTDAQLVRVARLFASDASLAAHLDDLPVDGERRRVPLASTPHLQMWAISWPAGSVSEWHDHGAACGAFVVVRGAVLEETHRSGVITQRLHGTEEHHTFGADVHRMSAFGGAPALTIHAYTPSLDGARTYDLRGGELVEGVAPNGAGIG